MNAFFKSKSESSEIEKKERGLVWKKDPAIQKEMKELVESLGLTHIGSERVYCYRTTGSKARAYARIWSFPKIFQEALKIEAAYAMEIISEKFDQLDKVSKKKVIIHELLHIPKNFSGSLLPHKYGNKRINAEVDILYKKYQAINSK